MFSCHFLPFYSVINAWWDWEQRFAGGPEAWFLNQLRNVFRKGLETVVKWFLNLILFIYNSSVTNSLPHRCYVVYLMYFKGIFPFFANTEHKHLTLIADHIIMLDIQHQQEYRAASEHISVKLCFLHKVLPQSYFIFSQWCSLNNDVARKLAGMLRKTAAFSCRR